MSIEPLLSHPSIFYQRPLHVIFIEVLPEWRNWQTQQTQNLPGITPRVGSTPSSGTLIFRILEKSAKFGTYKPFFDTGIVLMALVAFVHYCQRRRGSSMMAWLPTG